MSPTAKSERLRARLTINPDEPAAAPVPALAPVTAAPTGDQPPAAPDVAEEPTPLAEPAAPRSGGAPACGRPRRAAAAAVSALEDPTITPGRKDYRSFYIEDAVFARFRAAIYWLSRREDAVDEVPENMSVAVEAWMDATATALERRFNDGNTFRMPPPPARRRRSAD
jgi:hypothetical protein